MSSFRRTLRRLESTLSRVSRVSSYFSLNFHRFFVRLFNLEVPTSRAAPRFVFTTRLNERLNTNLSSVFHALFADVIISCFLQNRGTGGGEGATTSCCVTHVASITTSMRRTAHSTPNNNNTNNNNNELTSASCLNQSRCNLSHK